MTTRAQVAQGQGAMMRRAREQPLQPHSSNIAAWGCAVARRKAVCRGQGLSLIHISEPTRPEPI
eukprot:9115505-Pyramimonas_sp.AAC.1